MNTMDIFFYYRKYRRFTVLSMQKTDLLLHHYLLIILLSIKTSVNQFLPHSVHYRLNLLRVGMVKLPTLKKQSHRFIAVHFKYSLFPSGCSWSSEQYFDSNLNHKSIFCCWIDVQFRLLCLRRKIWK